VLRPSNSASKQLEKPSLAFLSVSTRKVQPFRVFIYNAAELAEVEARMWNNNLILLEDNNNIIHGL
jgi:hypothetical protein